MKLNLGCGLKKKSGWVNVDIKKNFKPDKIVDLNKFPYPFKNNSVEEVEARHVLEHLINPVKFLREMERVCKSDALIKIIVPHYLNSAAWADITHLRAFTGQTFDELNLAPQYLDLKMKLILVKYHSFRIFNFILNINRMATELIFARFIPINEIEFRLRVEK